MYAENLNSNICIMAGWPQTEKQQQQKSFLMQTFYLPYTLLKNKPKDNNNNNNNKKTKKSSYTRPETMSISENPSEGAWIHAVMVLHFIIRQRNETAQFPLKDHKCLHTWSDD